MRRPSPALVIAVLALFVSLGGATYAATVAPRNSVASTSIRTGAVTSTKVASRAITQSRIAPAAVGTTRLAGAAVTTDKLAGGAVTATRLADGAVSPPKLADSAVTGAKLGDGAVTSAKLADSGVTGAKVADRSLTGADIDVASLPVIHGITERQVNGPQQDVASNAPIQTSAACRPGETVVGGGASANSGDLDLSQSGPSGNGWNAVYYNRTVATIRVAQVVAWAFCAT